MSLPLLILAAGSSRRFGDIDKRRLTLPKGGEMLRAMIRRGGKAGLDVRPVLRRGDPLADQLPVPSILVDGAEAGMGASLAAAVAQLLADDPDGSREAMLVMPADLPLIRIHSIREVVAKAAGDRVVVPFCDGHRGHPVAIGRQFWPELLSLTGDSGAKGLIQSLRQNRAGSVLPLELADPGIYRDVDTPTALAEVLKSLDPPTP